MPKQNEYSKKKDSLKNADIDKQDNINNIASIANGRDFLNKEKRMREKLRGANNSDIIVKKQSNISGIVIDILLSIFIILVFAGLILGIYYVIDYYTENYDMVDVEYVALVEINQDMDDDILLDGEDLYLDYGDNSYYMGSVLESQQIEYLDDEQNPNKVIKIVVQQNLRYKEGEGYLTADHEKIAVGKRFNLRCGKFDVDMSIVEIEKISKNITE